MFVICVYFISIYVVLSLFFLGSLKKRFSFVIYICWSQKKVFVIQPWATSRERMTKKNECRKREVPRRGMQGNECSILGKISYCGCHDLYIYC